MMIARFRMLECGVNYRGTMKEICLQCKAVGDENHRLNHCIKYRMVNLYDIVQKVPFENIYSSDVQTLKQIIPYIEKVWNTRNANGTMNEYK